MAITNITEALDALQTLAEGLPAAVTVDDTLSVEGAAADAKAVGEALEIPYFDLVAMGLTDLKTTPQQSLQCDATTLAALVEAAKNGAAMFPIPYNGGTQDVIMSTVDIRDGLSYLFTYTTNLFRLGVGADLEYNDIYAVVWPHSVDAANVRAGTFAGQVVANSTAQTPATMLLRNSKLVTTETNPTNNGEICWTYE